MHRTIVPVLILTFLLAGCGGHPDGSPQAMQSTHLGGADTAGGDLHAIDFGSAWFLESRTVHYCVQVSPSFGVDPKTAVKTVRDAINSWVSYVGAKRINDKAMPEMRLATDFQEVADCSTTDLTFYLGVSNAETDRAKALFEDPISFAYRSQYDRNAGWGKGFIWMSLPKVWSQYQSLDWARPHALSGMLLHELGHVLGVGHVTGTIMETNVARGVTVTGLNPFSDPPLTGIDLSRELALCENDCDMHYTGRFHQLHPWTGPTIAADDAAFFSRLFGRPFQPPASAEVHFSYRSSADLSLGNTFTLTIGDRGGLNELPVTLERNSIDFPTGRGTFLRVRNVKWPGVSVPTLEYEGISAHGQLLAGTVHVGSLDLPVHITRNWSSQNSVGEGVWEPAGSALRMDVFLDGKWIPLFSAGR